MKKPFCFGILRRFFLVFILFFILYITYFVIFPHEAFAMTPYENITFDEDMISDEDVRARLTIARKEDFISYNGIHTYNTRLDIFRSLYPNGIPVDYSIINDSYDGGNYFDIPITMYFADSKNIDLSPGIYTGCIARNIDGLLI
jgi:hypothetical protein